MSVPVTVMLTEQDYAEFYQVAKHYRLEVGAVVGEFVRRARAERRPEPTPPARRRAKRTVWNGDMIAAVQEMHAQGMNDTEIGRVLGKHQTSVSTIRRDLGLPVIGKRRRPHA